MAATRGNAIREVIPARTTAAVHHPTNSPVTSSSPRGHLQVHHAAPASRVSPVPAARSRVRRQAGSAASRANRRREALRRAVPGRTRPVAVPRGRVVPEGSSRARGAGRRLRSSPVVPVVSRRATPLTARVLSRALPTRVVARGSRPPRSHRSRRPRLRVASSRAASLRVDSLRVDSGPAASSRAGNLPRGSNLPQGSAVSSRRLLRRVSRGVRPRTPASSPASSSPARCPRPGPGRTRGRTPARRTLVHRTRARTPDPRTLVHRTLGPRTRGRGRDRTPTSRVTPDPRTGPDSRASRTRPRNPGNPGSRVGAVLPQAVPRVQPEQRALPVQPARRQPVPVVQALPVASASRSCSRTTPTAAATTTTPTTRRTDTTTTTSTANTAITTTAVTPAVTAPAALPAVAVPVAAVATTTR